MDNNLAIYDNFMSNSNPDRLLKILVRYELFKLTLEVPGDICEFGVFKGSGLYTWAKLLHIFKPNTDYRVVGFDFFSKNRHHHLKYQEDRKVLDEHSTNWVDEDTISAKCESWGFSKLLLYPGNVKDTSARYAEEQFGSRISILYLDVDNYEGTISVLKNLYPMVSRGGLIVFDEYALPGYGESNAVDEFFSDKKVSIKCFPWGNTPSGFIVKE